MASLIVSLLVVAMLISKAADPRTWTWLTGDTTVGRESPDEVRRGSPGEVGRGSPDPALASDRRSPSGAVDHKDGRPTVGPVGEVGRPAPNAVAEVAQPAPSDVVTPGPTDTDPEEREAAQEQFQALSDGATELGREEMPAYWRLFGWVEHQSLAELERRASSNVVLNQFMQTPDEQRGKLFRLDLNVRRVLAYDAPPNSAGIQKVYEVWGWTTESKAWLYCVLTAHLPPGMPVGPLVEERATFAGYFLRVQGYYAAGAGPSDKPLAAPLFIGRLVWQPATAAQHVGAAPSWLWWLAGVVVLFGALRVGLWFSSGQRRRRRAPPLAGSADRTNPAELQGWLAEAAGDRGESEGYNEPNGESAVGGAEGGSRNWADFRDN